MNNFFEDLGSTFTQNLKIDITHKQVEQLKQAMKKLHRLDYSDAGIAEKREFESEFLQRLRDIQVEITDKEKANQLIDMQEVFDEIMKMVNDHVAHVDMVSKLNEDFNGTSMRTKKKSRNYSQGNKNSF